MQYSKYKIVEERAGFEPADGGTVTGFQDRLFQPLRHLSKLVSGLSLTDKKYYSRKRVFCQYLFSKKIDFR